MNPPVIPIVRVGATGARRAWSFQATVSNALGDDLRRAWPAGGLRPWPSKPSGLPGDDSLRGRASHADPVRSLVLHQRMHREPIAFTETLRAANKREMLRCTMKVPLRSSRWMDPMNPRMPPRPASPMGPRLMPIALAVLLTACEGSPMAIVHITALVATFAMFFATLNMDKVRR